jgi:hypothetical protein
LDVRDADRRSKARRVAICALVLGVAGCAPAATRALSATKPVDAKALANVTHLRRPALEAPPLWLEVERDVIQAGQSPGIGVPLPYRFRAPPRFTAHAPDGTESPACTTEVSDVPASTRKRFIVECPALEAPGVHSVELDPSVWNMGGGLVKVPVRVVRGVPATEPAPKGWRALSSTVARFPACDARVTHDVALVDGQIVFRTVSAALERTLVPAALSRLFSRTNPWYARYVLDAGDGWLVMEDHGEWGGGISFYSRGGDERAIPIGGIAEAEARPQNVLRALRVGDEIYLLQGLSHLGSSSGQFAKLWRENGSYTGQAIARFDSAPSAWQREPDGSWLIATEAALWRVNEAAGTAELVVRFPEMTWTPTSLAIAGNGTIYLGSPSGVLRLTPMWNEAPRYAADLLLPDALAATCQRF